MVSKMIFLFTDHGSLFQALQPSSSSNLTREVKTLHIPVAEKYGHDLEAESCQLAEFIAPDGSVQAPCEIEYFLANFAGLSFAGEKISLKEHEVLESLGPQEPWRALYG